jgi:hypothetical protein
MTISFNRKVARVMAAAVIATGGGLLAAQPAHAADVWKHVETYYLSNLVGKCYVRVSPGYYDYAEAQDMRPDGIGVYCRFKLSNGEIRDVSDSDGYGGANGKLDLTNTPYYIVSMQAVARNSSASAWTPTGA